MHLEDGSRVAVVGGGPAGSFSAYFLKVMSKRVGLDIDVDIYEPKDFLAAGPAGCNMCGGIVSESLVQLLAVEGILLPDGVVERGIDAYVMHSDVGTVRLETPLHELRIAAVHRGGGPRGRSDRGHGGLDNHLLERAREEGATIVRERVKALSRENGRPVVATASGAKPYDLLVGAVGVTGPGVQLFEGLNFAYGRPKLVKTYIMEVKLGAERIRELFGSAMHVFLLDLPRLEFAAIIPKGDFATLCMLGTDIDHELVESFLAAKEVRGLFPADVDLSSPSCHCGPSMNVGAARNPCADRVVVVGDCGASRLFKDGIGACYKAARAAAVTAVFEGVSREDFQRHYLPTYRRIERDNAFGRLIFMNVGLIKSASWLRRGIVGMLSSEQSKAGRERRLSRVMWDTFTGSASYRDIFLRFLDPRLVLPMATRSAREIFRPGGAGGLSALEG